MSSLRSFSMALPRISMARIPMTPFASSPAIITSPSNGAHLSGFSSMAPNHKDSSWSKSAKNAADKLENSAKKMAQRNKDYLREVKQYDCPEDEVLMELGLARSSTGTQQAAKGQGEGGHGFSKGFLNPGVGDKNKSQEGWAYTNNANGFEQTIMDQVQADVVHPSAKLPHHQHKHEPEMVSSLCQELKDTSSTSSKLSSSKLSSYASDAIRMVESHNILKHDRAPVHDMRDEDPSEHLANLKTK
ncbi:hypothetical protein BGZ93_011468 [Podila epicladia]|nr:hypothetical protein BGZ92_002013 [Podila epicladia]KAG0086493.1 hypothetical protein BGZ93_011468 [Podila epicladia]